MPSLQYDPQIRRWMDAQSGEEADPPPTPKRGGWRGLDPSERLIAVFIAVLVLMYVAATAAEAWLATPAK